MPPPTEERSLDPLDPANRGLLGLLLAVGSWLVPALLLGLAPRGLAGGVYFLAAGAVASLGSLAAVVTGFQAVLRGSREFLGAIAITLGLALLAFLGASLWLLDQMP